MCKIVRNVWLLASLLLLSAPVWAQESAPQKIEFDIQAQTVETALNEFAQTTGLQLIFPAEEFGSELRAPAVVGSYTARDALGKLLTGTGLGYEFINAKTVTIYSGLNATPADGRSSRSPVTSEDGVRMAQSETSSAGSDDSAAKETGAKDEGRPEDSPHEETLEEIVVTAQKRQERLQDVPISISVLRGDELDRSTAEGLTEALRNVPGVANTVAFQGGGTQLAVRGVSASGPLYLGSSPIAYYIDSVPFGLARSAIAPDSNAYDLERVEVLRGPQGTLYGASALNGVVRVLTKDAELDKFDLKARTALSNTRDGGENYRGDVAVNVPIVDGRLAARLVAGYQDASGWIDRPARSDANDAEIENFRLKLNAQPTSSLSIGASAWLSRSDFGATPGSADGLRNSATLAEPLSTDYDAFGLKVGYDFGNFSLTSMTSYLEYDNNGILDLNVFAVPGTLFTGFDADVSTEEIIVNSTRGESWRWSLGGIYRDADESGIQSLAIGGATIPSDAYRSRSESFAMFGELTRIFLDGRIELAGGLRYFEDDVLFTHGVLLAAPLLRTNSKFDAVTPRAVLSWHPTERTTIYGSYAEGFRSGFDQNLQTRTALPDAAPVEPDQLKNYEVGVKGNTVGNRFNYEAAVYFIDWEDIQQQLGILVNNIPVASSVNGDSVSGIGLEFAMTMRPTNGMELGVNFSWNDLAFDTTVFSGGVILFEEGTRLNYSPEYSIGASTDYVFPIGAGGLQGRFSASANYTSEQDVRSVLGTTLVQSSGDPMLIARASFSLTAADHWTASIFADNINNELDSPLRSPLAADFAVRVRPRTVGIQLEYRW
jgi:iron complex outermembrane recepter protein